MKRLFAILMLLAFGSAMGGAQPPPEALEQTDGHLRSIDLSYQLQPFLDGLVSLPLAAVFGAALAFRTRRRGTPARNTAVIQTQIILAVMGAMVMLVIGDSMARAFGIVGAAGLVRYRAKIADPKDAGVMLSTLAIGLAAGVGQYLLAFFGTLFILALLWIVESFEPKAYRIFDFTVKSNQPLELRPTVENVLRGSGALYELRSSSGEELVYEVKLPLERRTENVSNALLKLGNERCSAVNWEEKKKKF